MNARKRLQLNYSIVTFLRRSTSSCSLCLSLLASEFEVGDAWGKKIIHIIWRRLSIRAGWKAEISLIIINIESQTWDDKSKSDTFTGAFPSMILSKDWLTLCMWCLCSLKESSSKPSSLLLVLWSKSSYWNCRRVEEHNKHITSKT